MFSSANVIQIADVVRRVVFFLFFETSEMFRPFVLKTKTTQPLPQAPVVQTLDSAIHRINHYPADKYFGNQLRCPLDSDLSGG